MLNVASINLNKRVNNPATRSRLAKWVERMQIHVLLGQEPWNVNDSPPAIANLVSVGGNERVWVWLDSRLLRPEWRMISDFHMRIELGYLVIHNVYLSAYEQKSRAAQLTALREYVVGEKERPLLIVGDFNIAPADTDGVIDGKPSTFNSIVDRKPLTQLLADGHVRDLGSAPRLRQWTIERCIKGETIQFRCDLALASDYIASEMAFEYDHSVRMGPEAFTDHSALCLNLPVTLKEQPNQMTLFPLASLSDASETAFKFNPHKTAIHRKEPTPIARALVTEMRKHYQFTSVLDFGCGYGEDVQYYRSEGITADGYDPAPGFGWGAIPNRKYDLVTMLFVLNVLPDPWQRLKAMIEASSYLAPGGILVIATRTAEEIDRQARDKSWPRFNDGYWSHEGKGTFQRGLSRSGLLPLAHRAGLVPSNQESHFRPIPSTTCVMLEIPIDQSD